MTTVPPPVGGQQQPMPSDAPWLTPGAPSGPPVVAGGNRKTWLIAGGAVAAGVVVLAIATSGGGGTNDPAEVVQAHVDAFADGNWDRAYDTLCSSERDEYDDAADYGQRMEYRYGPALSSGTLDGDVERQDDGEVEVGVTLHTMFGDYDRTLDVVREDGGYRVCDGLFE